MPVKATATALSGAMPPMLSAMGMAVGKIDGRIGEQSREAVKKAQIKHSLPPDGYPTLALLQRMRQNP